MTSCSRTSPVYLGIALLLCQPALADVGEISIFGGCSQSANLHGGETCQVKDLGSVTCSNSLRAVQEVLSMDCDVEADDDGGVRKVKGRVEARIVFTGGTSGVDPDEEQELRIQLSRFKTNRDGIDEFEVPNGRELLEILNDASGGNIDLSSVRIIGVDVSVEGTNKKHVQWLRVTCGYFGPSY